MDPRKAADWFTLLLMAVTVAVIVGWLAGCATAVPLGTGVGGASYNHLKFQAIEKRLDRIEKDLFLQ